MKRLAVSRLLAVSVMSTRLLLIALVAMVSLGVPAIASAQTLRGTSFVTEAGDHTVEWNDNWVASLTSEDDFSTMVMLEGQIMIYAVMFVHDPDLGLSERAVYHSLSGVLASSFEGEPLVSVEWAGDDDSYRGAHILQIAGIDFVLYMRVDPATAGTGPVLQFAAAPVQAFPVSLEAMQAELTVDGVPVLDGDNGDDVMARLAAETDAAPADSVAESEAPPATGLRPADDGSHTTSGGTDTAAAPGQQWVSNANGYTVGYPDVWLDMASTDSTIGEFSLISDTGRAVVSFSGRPTTETNREAFFEDIAARESRYPGFVDSVVSEDRLLIATWTADNELALLEYVFINDTTVVTIMVTITGANPDRSITDVRTITLNGDPILRDLDDIWPAED